MTLSVSLQTGIKSKYDDEIYLSDYFRLVFSVINMEANNSASISLVPCPTNVVPGTGSFQFTPKTVFAVETEEQAAIVRLLSDQFTCAAGFTPKLKVDSKKGNLVLQTDKTIKSEAYCLEITPKKITVKASDAKVSFMLCRVSASYCRRQ